ncbi:acyl-CoA dehydrogenase [Flavobacterium aestivum]|uniref:acyl-CoA dehydrogenase family protein n=1 Tax=Flavobacterium aestivum TaxID=3003257 RepID=UPI0024823543|nr:acyl-CoA dehydrogenase [Flavobacterium aestivum]
MENPKLKAFIPFFYLVWSDDILTQKEFFTLQEFINSQDWISQKEKDILFSKINILAPPSREELTGWKSEMEKVIHLKPSIRSILGISIVLSKNDKIIKDLRSAFIKLENDLGILGEEAIGNFRESKNTFTLNHQAVNRFNTKKLTQVLDGKQSAIIKKVKSVISRPEFAYETSTDTDVYREKVYHWCKILAKENFGNMAFPKKYGGRENLVDYFTVMETLSYYDLSLVIKFGVQFGLWGMSIQSLGTEKHYNKYLKDIGSLKLPGCFAMTETNHGSNVKGLETTATYNHVDQTFTIHTPNANAQKEYIGNAAKHGQIATVFAKLIIDGNDYGINAFIVPLRDMNGKTLKGITIGDCGLKMGLNGVDNGTIRFENVVISKENMLDRFASVNEKGKFESPIPSDNRRFFTMLGTLVGGRIGIPRSALAAAKSGLAIAIIYSDKRRQFGPEGGSEVPILNYRMHQRRLIPLLAKTYAMHFALQYVTNRFIDKKESEVQEIEALVAGMKAYVTWSTRDILQECREACGGKGYLSENRIDALKNDTEIYTTFEGDNTVLMQLVAKNRLAEFRKSFGEMSTIEVINYVYESTKTRISEKNPIVTRKTDDEHLLDNEFHLNAFEYREKATVTSLAKRIKKLIDSGLEPYDAYNVVQHQMIDVSQAYLERIILEQFQIAVQSVKDKKCKEVVLKLSQLYALSQIERNKGWYLEEGYMEAVKTKAIRKMVNQLCWEIRQDAVSLVKAFDIPESCLAAPIVL